ncbi:MAG: hypothetical protein QXW71_03790 [Thermoplasmata archaeon]
MKLSVFPFNRLKGSDIILGPEMKSTGEIMGIGRDPYEAFYKAFLTAYGKRKKSILFSLNDYDKKYLDELSEELLNGFEIYATEGTANYLMKLGVKSNIAYRLKEKKKPTIYSLIEDGKIGYVINTPSRSYVSQSDGYKIRRFAVDFGVPVITNMRVAKFLIRSINLYDKNYLLYPFNKFSKVNY